MTQPVLTPVFTATVTTIFKLHVADINGCEAEDEVVVSVSTVGYRSLIWTRCRYSLILPGARFSSGVYLLDPQPPVWNCYPSWENSLFSSKFQPDWMSIH
jgi:hypothetical protein